MKRTALGLALALSVAGSACALHPVADSGYEEPYYASGGERAAYEYEQRRAHEQQRAYAQQRAYEHAAARDAHARSRAYEHERRERDRYERDRYERDRAVQAAHERSSWERHADARNKTVQVTGHGPAGGRVAPVQAPTARPAPSAPPPQARQVPMARPAPADPAQNKGRARWVDAHRSVARPE